MYFYDPDSRTEMLTYLYWLDSMLIGNMNTVDDYKSAAWDYNKSYDYYNAIKQLCLGLSAFTETMRWFVKGVSGWSVDYPRTYFSEHHTGVTYKSICEAWGKDDFEGRAVTIAFIDRMRQLIWGEPYFVAWAAKPEEEF